MADTATPKLGLTRPEVGASRDTWGTKTNGNWDIVDAQIYGRMPIGARVGFCGITAPPGWLQANGQAIPRATYPELFAVIGTTYGAGDGTTTFNMPNYNGKVAVGLGSYADANGNTWGLSLGQILGNFAQVLSAAYMPVSGLIARIAAVSAYGATDAQGDHSHGVNDPGHAHSYLDRVNTGTDEASVNGSNAGGSDIGRGTSASGTGIWLSNAGNHAHNVGVAVPAQDAPVLGGGGASLGLMQPSIGEMQIIFTGRLPPSVAVAIP